MRINAWSIYDRLSAGVGQRRRDQLRPVAAGVLALVGVLFLIIQFVALVIGLRAGASDHRRRPRPVHRHAAPAQPRLRLHRFPVRARDQLGELAESFNVMTGEVTTLLGEMAEKGRMEQEMLAAREIQQKLLPPAPLQRPRPGARRRFVNRRARWQGTTTTSCRSPTRCSEC